MATLDWSQCPAVERVPGKMGGDWVLRGTRMPVATVFENLASGARLDDIVAWYDGVDPEQVKAVIDFVVLSLQPTPVWPDFDQRRRDILGDRVVAPGGSDIVAEGRGD